MGRGSDQAQGGPRGVQNHLGLCADGENPKQMTYHCKIWKQSSNQNEFEGGSGLTAQRSYSYTLYSLWPEHRRSTTVLRWIRILSQQLRARGTEVTGREESQKLCLSLCNLHNVESICPETVVVEGG